jgi:hypothetical protein
MVSDPAARDSGRTGLVLQELSSPASASAVATAKLKHVVVPPNLTREVWLALLFCGS